MKIDRLIWGILFLFVGGVLLLDNFDVITFYWRNVWQFWPVILIIVGVNILLGKKESNIGSIVSLSILVITLAYLFYRGQQPPEHSNWMSDRFHTRFNFEDDREDNGKFQQLTWAEPYKAVNNATLNVFAGGTSIDLEGSTDSLVAAAIKRRYGSFKFEKEETDSNYTVTIRTSNKNKNNTWSVGTGGNDIDLRMNTNPVWDVNMNMGAGSVEMDLSGYKIRKFNFDGGAASVEIRLGSLQPLTNITIKTGVADVSIKIPEGSGCQIRTKTGLSVKDFEGFNKIRDGVYETSNFASAPNKILMKFDGGLSNFEVNRY